MSAEQKFAEELSKKFNEHFEFCKTKLKEGVIVLTEDEEAERRYLDDLAFDIAYNYLIYGICPSWLLPSEEKEAK